MAHAIILILALCLTGCTTHQQPGGVAITSYHDCSPMAYEERITFPFERVGRDVVLTPNWVIDLHPDFLCVSGKGWSGHLDRPFCITDSYAYWKVHYLREGHTRRVR